LKFGYLPYLFREGFRRFVLNVTNIYLFSTSNLHFKSIRQILFRHNL